MNTLFRPEVQQARAAEVIGSISLRAPRLGWIAVVVGVVMVSIALLILTFGTYTQKVRANGVLVSNEGLIKLESNAGGTITRIFMKQGQLVKAGDALLEISDDTSSSAEQNTKMSILGNLNIKLNRYRLDLADADEDESRERLRLTQKMESLSGQIDQVSQQVSIQKERVTESEKLFQQWQGLESTGVVSKLQILEKKDAAMQNLSQLKDISRQLLVLEADRDEARQDLLGLPEKLQLKKNDILRQLADVQSSITQEEVSRASIVRAPVSGTVSGLLVWVGESATEKQLLATLMPSGAHLEAEFWLPARSMGFVKDGDEIILRYDAFPYELYGQRRGRVSEIATTALTQNEVPFVVGLDNQEARFRVRAVLDEQSFDVDGIAHALSPGTSFDGTILVGKRRISALLLPPGRN